MPAALDRPSGTLEMNTAASTDRLTEPPRQQPEAEDHRLGDAVEQRADGDGGTAAGLLVLRRLLVPGALAVPGAVPGQASVRREVDHRAAEETRAPSAASPPVVAASSMRSKATAEIRTPEPKAITDGDDLARHLDEPRDQGAEHQGGRRRAAPRDPPPAQIGRRSSVRVAQQVAAEVRHGEGDLARARRSRPGPS